MQRLVVIGGDAAGMSCASQVKRLQPEMKITVFEKGPYTSYAACGIPYYVAGLVDTKIKLIARTPEYFIEKMGIDVHINHEVIEVSPAAHSLFILNHDTGQRITATYDQLVFATGASPVRPALPGINSDNVHDVNDLVHGALLKRALEKSKPGKAVIIGGGYIGIEVAEALLLRGINVTLVQRPSQVMRTVDPEIGTILGTAMKESGVELRLGESVVGFEQAGNRVTAVVTDQGAIPADFVVLGLGVRPNSTVAEQAGIPLGPKKAIKVNEHQQTDCAAIWAAGDCAQCFNLVSNQPDYFSLGTIANKQGRVAGLNIGGKKTAFPGAVGTSIIKFMETEVSRTGLNEEQLNRLGIEFVTTTVKGYTRPRYYPGSTAMTVKVLAEKGSGRLLGAQIIGGPGAAKRIDTAATALHARLTLEDMLYLDLAYAPPFSGVWEPLIIAARLALRKV